MSDHSDDIPTGDSLPYEAVPEEPAEGNLEKIRELLFGREMNTVEQRFARLEARLEAEAAALHADIAQRMETLEATVKEEFASLNEALAQERKDRTEALERAASDSDSKDDALERMLHELKAENDQTAQAIRQQIETEATNAQNALTTATEDLRSALAEQADALQDRKADRAALAAIFTEAAARLNGDA